MISLVDLIFHSGGVTPQCELPLFRSIRITESSDAHLDKGEQFSYSDFKYCTVLAACDCATCLKTA
jgi:hypothetical protein